MSCGLRMRSLRELQAIHPEVSQLLAAADPQGAKPDLSFGPWLDSLDPAGLAASGLDPASLTEHVEALVRQADALLAPEREPLSSLSVLGGVDKEGRRVGLDLEIKVGQVVCVVGPTGSGKSRLLADIECLAQGDTPSGRTILVNGRTPDAATRFGADRRLVAQLSQNMNFVVDLSVAEFLAMHAICRNVCDPESVVAKVIACANDLAGERFSAETSLTQLSGGQSRSLMIADIAFLSASPIVLIDEIENAGVDRRKALDLLVAGEKIVLISTHDPILALMGDRRIVIRHGAIADIIATSAGEAACLEDLRRIDARLAEVRQTLRSGGKIDNLSDGAV